MYEFSFTEAEVTLLKTTLANSIFELERELENNVVSEIAEPFINVSLQLAKNLVSEFDGAV